MKKLTNGVLRRFDLNGDGKLNFNEFKYSMQPTK
jgi:Ca2+-binding EF-hand superfamily protein